MRRENKGAMDLLTNDEIDQAVNDSGRARRETEHRRCVENISLVVILMDVQSDKYFRTKKCVCS